MSRGIAVERLGEDALLLRIAAGGAGAEATLAAVHALAVALAVDRPPWLQDIVPAYATLALFVDPAVAGPGDPLDVAAHWLHARLQARPGNGDAPHAGRADGAPRTVDIPVHYGGADGPDLDAVAGHCGLSPAEVVARHAAAAYTVAMLGFAPGFPYLVGLDPALATPRRTDPRVRVPAGSVGIGGGQTGIYPAAGPGGWQLIGRTAVALFDAARSPPALLRAGDRLRFVDAGPAALAGDGGAAR